MKGAQSVTFSAADPDVVYVTSETLGHVVQLNASSGEVISVSPSFGHHITGLGINGRRHDFGRCVDNHPRDNRYHCTGPHSEIEGNNLPEGQHDVECHTEADCHPTLINATYIAVESTEGCGQQAILRHVNRTERVRATTHPFKVLPSEGEGQFRPRFGGWMRDRGLQYAYHLQYHDHAGVLVSTGPKISRYDPDTGDFLHDLVDLSEEVKPSGSSLGALPGDITCFQLV